MEAPESLPDLFRSEDWRRLRPYLTIHPPLSTDGAVLGDVRRPAAEVVGIERSREVGVDWRDLVRGFEGAPSLYLAAFRDWIESTWPASNWQAKLRAVIVRATDETPFYEASGPFGFPVPRPTPAKRHVRGVVLLNPHSGRHLLVSQHRASDDESLFSDLLSGGSRYLSAWQLVDVLTVVSQPPSLPIPLFPPEVDRPPFPYPRPGWPPPPRDIELDPGWLTNSGGNRLGVLMTTATT